MSLSVQMQRSYKSKNGNRTFVYTVSGKPSDIEAYREAQGEFYREDDKTNNPLWFTTKCIGKTGTLIITDNGKIAFSFKITYCSFYSKYIFCIISLSGNNV